MMVPPFLFLMNSYPSFQRLLSSLLRLAPGQEPLGPLHAHKALLTRLLQSLLACGSFLNMSLSFQGQESSWYPQPGVAQCWGALWKLSKHMLEW